MRAQASMEFSLVFAFAFLFFIVLLGLVTSSLLGLGDTRPQKASAVLDTIAVYASSLEHLGPSSQAVIRFDVPNSSLPGAVFSTDTTGSVPILRIVESSKVIGSRDNLTIEVRPTAPASEVPVDGNHTLTYENGVLTLA